MTGAEYDHIVIGAGMSGMSAAYHLAELVREHSRWRVRTERGDVACANLRAAGIDPESLSPARFAFTHGVTP